jgi:hypothetical protein
MRHGHLSEFEPCVRNLHDHVAAACTDATPIAKPEANSAFGLSVAVANSIRGTGRDRRNPFTRCTAKFGAARSHRRKR